MTTAKISQISPLMAVKDIEPCIQFWEKLGFEKIVAVPESGKPDFVILQGGAAQVMYQTIASITEDLGDRSQTFGTHGCLYISTPNIENIEAVLQGMEVVVAKRKTFYGATEIFYREPGGHIVGFAEMSQ